MNSNNTTRPRACYTFHCQYNLSYLDNSLAVGDVKIIPGAKQAKVIFGLLLAAEAISSNHDEHFYRGRDTNVSD